MTAELTLGMGTGILGAVALWSLTRARQEFGRARSTASATAVWVIYIGHLVLTIVASAWSIWPLPLPLGPSFALGALLLAGGVAICAQGMRQFRSFRRMSGLDTQQLITTGIYAWSRNPQNVGWIAGLFGIALLGRSGLGLLLAGVFAAVFLVYVQLEERHLQAVFGDEYRRYLQHTHRIFGPPSRR